MKEEMRSTSARSRFTLSSCRSIAAVAAIAVAACSHSTPAATRVHVKPSVPRVVQASIEHPGWAVFSPIGNAGIVAIAAGFSTHVWASVWNADANDAEVLRIAFDGSSDAIKLPTRQADPAGLVAGPRGDMWVAEAAVGKIGEITMPDGPIVEFPLHRAGASPIALAVGADRDLWYVDDAHGIVGKMTSDGATTEFRLPDTTRCTGIAANPAGGVWYSGFGGDVKAGYRAHVGMVSPDGKVTEYRIAGDMRPTGVAIGGDGNAWVAVESVRGDGEIVRVTPSGMMRAYDAMGQPDAIAADGTDTLDFTLASSPSFGEITLGGQVSTLPLPGGANARAGALSVAPNGDEWFVGTTGTTTALYVRLPSKIDVSPASITLDVAGASQKIKVSEKKYSGKWTVQSSDDGIADATGGKLTGEFTVVAISQGTCTLTIADRKGGSILVPVTVK